MRLQVRRGWTVREKRLLQIKKELALLLALWYNGVIGWVVEVPVVGTLPGRTGESHVREYKNVHCKQKKQIYGQRVFLLTKNPIQTNLSR